MAILDLFRDLGPRFEAIRAYFEECGPGFGPILGNLYLGLFGPFRTYFRSLGLDFGHFCQFLRVWTSTWAILDLFWEFVPQFRAFRAYFGESGPQIGPFYRAYWVSICSWPDQVTTFYYRHFRNFTFVIRGDDQVEIFNVQ